MSKILANIFELVSDVVVDRPERVSNDTLPIKDNINTASSQSQSAGSMLDDLKARQSTQAKDSASCENSDNLAQILRQRYKKRGILISYDTKGCFQLKRVVSKVVEDLKSLGFQDDVWFDKDEGETTSKASFAQRLESSEGCNAAILFVSRQYFHSTQSGYEAEIFRQRSGEITSSGIPFRVFVVKYSQSDVPVPAEFLNIDLDLTVRRLSRVSAAEKASAVVGALCVKLEGYVTFSTKLYRELYPESRDSVEHRAYKNKPVHTWDVGDVQEWLGSLGVHERYRVSFEESEIDGYLLKCLKECDMLEHLNVDSKSARQKIFHSLSNILMKETSWDRACQNRRMRDNIVYLVCDPVDLWIAEFIKSDLVKVGIMAQMHNGSGFSKSSSRLLAEAGTVIFLLTSSSDNSYVVFQEILLAAWLEKQIITAAFDQSASTSARHALRAIVAKQPAINFESGHYLEGLDVLRYHVSRGRGVLPRVILQQNYAQKMRDSLRPIDSLLQCKGSDGSGLSRPKVFLSYHWDMQNKVGKIKEYLDRHGCETTTDASKPIASSIQSRSCKEFSLDQAYRTPVLVQDGISKASIVVLCITLKYLHCDNFIKDTQLAELHRKSALPVMLQWCPRPLDRIAAVAKRLDVTSALIDLSNEQLLRKNLPKLLELIMKT